jgi:hypothetical protein
MKKIALIVPYFGEIPDYTDIFFKSLEFNKEIDVILFTDQQLCIDLPNLIVYKISFEDIKTRIQEKFPFEICLNNPYKLCDYRPSFGYVFDNELKEYDFWGYCDLDEVFGRVVNFLNENILENYDKIYQHGHLTLYKNTLENNKRFMLKGGMDYEEVFTTNVNCIFDEVIGIQNKYDLLGVNTYKNRDNADILPWHDKFIRVESYLSQNEKINFNYKKQVFFWENGSIYRAAVKNNNIIYDEFNYLHFQKRNLKKHFYNVREIKSFFITKYGFYPKKEGFNVTREDIQKYNGFNMKSELTKRINYYLFILKRRINKYLRNK